MQTSVISVTLNGERRKLKMHDGTSEQVDCLSNADAYVPSADLSTDVAAVLQHHQVTVMTHAVVFAHSAVSGLAEQWAARTAFKHTGSMAISYRTSISHPDP